MGKFVEIPAQVEAWQWDGTEEGLKSMPEWLTYDGQVQIGQERSIGVKQMLSNGRSLSWNLYVAEDWLVRDFEGIVLRMSNETFRRKYKSAD